MAFLHKIIYAYNWNRLLYKNDIKLHKTTVGFAFRNPKQEFLKKSPSYNGAYVCNEIPESYNSFCLSFSTFSFT